MQQFIDIVVSVDLNPKNEICISIIDVIIVHGAFSDAKTISKVSNHSRGWPEGSLFDSYYTKV